MEKCFGINHHLHLSHHHRSINKMFLFFTSLLFVLFLLWRAYGKCDRKTPPGPPCLPVIGSILSVFWADARDPSIAISKLSKKYGPIMRLQMGAVPIVAICGHEMLSNVVKSEELITRVDETDIWLLEKSNSVPLGILFSVPEIWKDTRAYMHKTLRKYGLMALSSSSSFILEEIVDLCNNLKREIPNGKASVTIDTQFCEAFFNISWTFVTGNKYKTKGTKELLGCIEAWSASGKHTGSIVQIYPSLITLFPGLTGFNKLKEVCAYYRNTIQAVVHEARQDGAYKTNPSNFLEEFLQEVESIEKPINLLDTIYTEENLVAILQDMTLASSDTLSHFVKFYIRYLVEYPDVQDKLREEIERVVGDSRLVSADDFPNLKYVQATVIELFRIVGFGPIVPRKLLKNWKLGEYEFPKGTTVILNLWSGDMDDKVYEDPHTFNPARFLNEDGTVSAGTDKLFAFGLGKRRCFGEQLGKNVMMLAAVTLVQYFSFHVDPKFGMKWPRDILGFSKNTAPYNIIIKTRQ